MVKKELDIPGIKVSSIDDVAEEADLTPKETSFIVATEEMEKVVGKAFEKGPLKDVVSQIAASPDNAFRQVERVEVKAFDVTFLNALETGMDAIARILANPRTFIKETQEIENVEKAKKVSVASIQHFATHSQYLRSVEESGEVIPDKILTIHSETNTAIYENRFVMTLIKRTLSFVEQRYKYVREHGETKDSDELFVHSKVEFGGVEYDCSFRVKASIPSEDAGDSSKNEELLKRLDRCRERCGDFLHSNFMTQMKGAKDISSPVHMTNMLLKHPDYHAAYELWEFIEKYDSLGVSYDVKEKASSFDPQYLKALYQLVAQAMLKLHSRHKDKARTVLEDTAKRVTPRIIFGLDELNYDDSRFLYDAFPEAEDYPPAEELVTEEERAEVVKKKVEHLANEEVAEVRLTKKINKDKDTLAFEAAKGRNAKKAVLEEKARIAKEEEDARKKEEIAERARKAREARAKKKEEEDARYEEERKKLIGEGK